VGQPIAGFPQIHWLEGASNVYLYASENGLTLIDSDRPGRAAVILEYVRHLGHEPSALKQIVITHADWDHAGSAAALQAATGATVYAGAMTASLLPQGKSPHHFPRVFQFIIDRFFGYPPLPATSITVIADGEQLPLPYPLHALSSPGHTPDHFSFVDPTHGILFAGDALNTRGGELGLARPLITDDVAAAHRSARRLLQQTPSLFACGHGPPLQGHSAADLIQFLQTLSAA
jgi:glyoxylase-like metal-dependent hydrolase (beta-lactamase superfamily II)